MKIEFQNLIEATWIERRKRFMLDVAFDDGTSTTAHCPNTGAMSGVSTPGSRVLLSTSDNPKRKYAHTLEAVRIGSTWVGVNTQNPNKIGMAMAKAGAPPFPSGLIRPEVRYGKAERVDILIEDENAQRTFVEIKNVHHVRNPGEANFPDCVTSRGAKHLYALANEVAAGHRAINLFLIQRDDVSAFTLARDIDPGYAEAFDYAASAGVEMCAVRCSVSHGGIEAAGIIPILEKTVAQAA